MGRRSRIYAIASAYPPHRYSQETIARYVQDRTLSPGWQERPEAAAQARQIERIFAASRVERRQSAIDLLGYYERSRTTGERMVAYQTAAYALGRCALEGCLGSAPPSAAITDLIVVSCTGYSAPGLDVQLARDLALSPAVRRTTIGHMGCFGALVGLRHCRDALVAHPGAVAALLSVELCSLHFMPSRDLDVLTSFALFGDAGAALLVSDSPEASGPELVDSFCLADFAAADQMSWTITDQGFMMSLSPRVPVTLRRNVAAALDGLLAPHDLAVPDIDHWIIHPGGPSILDAIQNRLELSDEQMALSWQVLREHGNCSSATVLLILEKLMASGRARSGDWCVMMAFGPGLTLETCLLRF
jgi:alkylresorcinol/alkylpyrone synthase